MKKIVSIAVVALAIAACAALFGCGGIDEKAFVGDWTAIEMSDNGQKTTVQENPFLSMFTVQLTSDHKATMSLMGESVTGEWKATAADKGTLTLKSDNQTETIDFTLKDGKLVMEQNGSSFTFEKVTTSSSSK